jgi:hypothetical protein
VKLVKLMLSADINARPSAAQVRDTLRRDLKWAMWTAEQRVDELRALMPDRFA